MVVVVFPAVIIYSLVVSSLCLFSNTAHATIYDFGSLIQNVDSETFQGTLDLKSVTERAESLQYVDKNKLDLAITNKISSSYDSRLLLGSLNLELIPIQLDHKAIVQKNEKRDGFTSGEMNVNPAIYSSSILFQSGEGVLQNFNWAYGTFPAVYLDGDISILPRQGIRSSHEHAAHTLVRKIKNYLKIQAENLAMMLVGLGLIVISVHRRRSVVYD